MAARLSTCTGGFMNWIALVPLAAALAAAAAARAEPPRYLVTPVENPSPNVRYVATAMNDLGQVVGTGGEAGVGPAWLWTSGGGVTRFPGYRYMVPLDINNAGQVLFSGSVFTPVTGLRSVAPIGADQDGVGLMALNNSGMIVGYVEPDGSSPFHAAFWPTPDTIQLIPKLPGRTGDSTAIAINDRGDIVGSSRLRPPTDSSPRGFLRTAEGTLVDLGTLPGRAWSGAWRVNNHAHVIGSSFNTVDDWRGFLWTPERGMRDLEDVTGVAMAARDINDSDVIIGHSLETDRAVYWSPEDGLHEFDALLDSSASGWRIGSVFDLNNAGQVLATSLDLGPRGEVTHLLLTPVPEPAGAAVILATLGLAAARRRPRGLFDAP